MIVMYNQSLFQILSCGDFFYVGGGYSGGRFCLRCDQWLWLVPCWLLLFISASNFVNSAKLSLISFEVVQDILLLESLEQKNFMPAKPCTSWSPDNNDCPLVVCCFTDNAKHPYHKQFICQDCHRGMAPHAQKMLKLLNQGTMTEGQLQLLASMVKKKQKHSEYIQEALSNDYKMDREGTKLKEQSKAFCKNTKRSMDEEFKLLKSMTKKKQYKAHLAAGIFTSSLRQ